jgi:hypothetical protein
MIAVVLIMLTGCIQTFPFRGPSEKNSEPIDLNELFETVAALQQADPDSLRDSAIGADPDDPSELLGWALVMTMLGEPSDKARATELFTAYLDRPGQTPGSAMLATVLRDQLQSELKLQRRLSLAIRQRNDLNRRILTEQTPDRAELNTHALEAIIRERDSLTAQLEELKANERRVRDSTLRATIRERDELTTQLEELKAIERQIRDRKSDPNLDLP